MAEEAEAFEPHPQMLADALHSLLKPLKLTNGIRFKEQSTPVERVEFFHRQELCWIRIQEAPVPPPEPPIPNSVRIGGGFYIPEIRESAVEAAKAAAERVKRANSTVRRGSTATLDRAATIDGSAGQRLSVDGSPNRSQSVSDGTGSLSVNDAGGRKLSKSGTMTLEREASLQKAERRISRSLTPTPDKVNSLTAGPVLLGAAAASEKKGAAGGATSGDDEEGEVWDPYNDDTESNVGGSSMNLGEYLEGEGEAKEKRRVPSKFLHGEVQASTEDDRRGHGFHFGTFTRGSSRSRFGDRRGLHPGEKAEDFMGATTQSDCAFRVLTSARRRRSSLPVPQRRGSKDLSASGPEPSCPGSEAMEALLAALGHDVVELDRLQVQRSECKVADKWKVELCYMYADCPTERVVEKQVEVMVEKKVQVPVEVPRPRPLSDDTGCQTTGIWCTYCGAPGHTRANCPLLALQKRVKELEDLLKGPRHENCQLCGSDRHMAPYCPSLQKPPGSNVGVQTDPSCQLCARFGHHAPQCPLLAQLMQPKVEEKAARIRVGGGWLIAPQVPGLKEGGLNESDALELLASANTAGCLSKDGHVEYLGPPQSPGGSISRPSSAPPARPAKPPTAPTSPRRGRPSTQNASTSPRGDGQSPQSPHVAQTYAPKDPARVLSGGQMGPERFKQMEEERRNLSERISNGQGKAPSTGPRGFIIGTFVQGSHDRHRLSSDTGPRTMYRVYRSGISSDAAMDSETLEKRSNSRSNSRRSSLASVRSDSPFLGLPGELLQEGGSSAASDEDCGCGDDHGCHGCHGHSHEASPQIVIVPAGSATEAVRRFSHTSASSRSGSPSPDAPARSSSRHSTRSSP